MLRFIKSLHTVIWAGFAGAILALPWLAWRGERSWAWWIIAAVFAEGVVLLINKGRCPLTPWAERHTDDRRPNFDIYLPVWLAKWNKWIFTLLFALGLGVALWREFAGV